MQTRRIRCFLGVALTSLGLGLTACQGTLGNPGDGSGGQGGALSSGSLVAGNTNATGANATNGNATNGNATGANATSANATSANATSANATSANATVGAGPATTSSGGPATFEQHCVDQINQYRATLGLPPYQRWDTAETCADQQSQSDGTTMTAHGAFQMCGEWAQNECPGWPGTPDTIIDGCLAQMWAEGPGAFNQGHGHYINMSSTQYTKVACGAYLFPDGKVWSVQDFQ